MSSELLADQPLGEKLIKKWFWLYLFAYLIAPAGYLVKVIISNSVSVADVGVLYSIVGLVWLLNVYNDLGLTESLQYFLPRYWLKKQYNYIKTSIYISLFAQLITAILIGALLRVWAPWLAENYFHSPSAMGILRYFCLYFLWINLLQSLQNIFLAFQDTFSSKLVEFVRMRSVVAFTILFFLNEKQSIERYSLNRILWLVLGIIVAGIIFYIKYRKHLLQWEVVLEKPMLREYINYAVWAFIWLNIGSVFWQVIQQIVLVMIGPESAWYYTNFLSLFAISFVIIWPIMGLIFPMVSQLASSNDIKKLSVLCDFFYTHFMVFSFSLTIIFLFLWKELALVIFWTKFLFSGTLLSMSAVIVVVNTLSAFNFAVLAWLGKIKERVKVLIISVILMILTSILWIMLIGIYGAILGFVVWEITLFVLSYFLLEKQISFTLNYKFIVKNISLMLLLGCMIRYFKNKIFVLDDIMRHQNLWRLILLWVFFYLSVSILNRRKLLVLKREINRLRN